MGSMIICYLKLLFIFMGLYDVNAVAYEVLDWVLDVWSSKDVNLVDASAPVW